MKSWTIPIYLYFLNENQGYKRMFQDHLFHFHRIASIHKTLFWNRIFVFENQKVQDRFFDKTIATLTFHHYIHPNGSLTDKGSKTLEKSMKEVEFQHALSHFQSVYNGEYAVEKACFVSIDHFPTACHLCENHVCEKEKSLLKSLTSMIKPKKNPYRSYSKAN